jgi:hypothetical protein
MRRFPLAPLSERQQELLGGGGRQVNRVVRIQRRRQAGAVASPGSVSTGGSARAQRRLEQARGRLRVALTQPAVDPGDCLAALDLDLDALD